MKFQIIKNETRSQHDAAAEKRSPRAHVDGILPVRRHLPGIHEETLRVGKKSRDRAGIIHVSISQSGLQNYRGHKDRRIDA